MQCAYCKSYLNTSSRDNILPHVSATDRIDIVSTAMYYEYSMTATSLAIIPQSITCKLKCYSISDLQA